MVAHKPVGLSAGAGRSCGDTAKGNRHFSEVYDSLLGVIICGAIQFRCGGGEIRGAIEAIRASEAIEAIETIREADVNIVADVRELECYIELPVGGTWESQIIESQR